MVDYWTSRCSGNICLADFLRVMNKTCGDDADVNMGARGRLVDRDSGTSPYDAFPMRFARRSERLGFGTSSKLAGNDPIYLL